VGRVTRLFPGRDNNVRVVKVKTACGKLLRPVQHVYPLEVHSSSAWLSNRKTKTTNPSVLALDTHDPDTAASGAECLCYKIREDSKHTDPISPIKAA
jgi:hypothetical protein